MLVTDGPRAGLLQTVGPERRKLREECLSGAGKSIGHRYHAKPVSNAYHSPGISKAGRQTGQTRLRSIQRRRAERCSKESSKWH